MESHTQVGALLEENDTWEKKLQDPSATPMFLPFEFLTEITCNFSSERELGRGGYGVVYKGVLPSGKTIAVKRLFDLHRLEDEKFQKEVSYLMGIKHTNVVLFVGYCAKSSWEAIDQQGGGSYIFAETRERLLCFEHVCNKSLDKYISDESSGLEWEMRYEIVRGICAGLHYLHEECHIVHLDLKPENILMDATMVPKIADFGLSKIFGDKQTRIITVNRPGTHGYMAPEYLIQGVVSIKADIYSLGVIIIEILTGYRNYPLSSLPHFQQLSEDNSRQITASFQYFKENILETWRKRLQKSQGDTILEQIRVCTELGIQCVEFNPENRPVTRHMIDRLDEVNIMDISIKSSESSTPPVLQVGEASDTVQQGDTRSKISCKQEEGCEVHNAELADVYENIRAADIKSEIKVPFHRVTCEVNKHHVLESMLRDESVEPTCLELSLLEDITNNFSKDHEIGRSRLGVVYKGKLSSGSTVVVKRLAIASAVEDSLFLHAVNSLMSIKHRNIVRFLGYCSNVQEKVTREGDTSIIVMVRKRLLCFEYLRKGNLQKHLTDESRGFHWHARYQTIKGICQGLQYLHDDYIPHLDLKPDNILFSETMVPKILDYGFSRVFTNEIRQTIFKNIDGSLACMATPEYLTGAEITLKSDIYSLGLIIMQIVTGPNNMDYSNIASIVESWRSRLELEAPKEHTFETCYQQVKVCVDIGMRCMDHDPRNRPVTQYIINCLDRMERERSVGSYMIFPSEATSQPSDAELIESPVPHAPPAVQPGRKIVLNVPMNYNKSRSVIMEVASKITGIMSLAYDSDKSTLTVVGDVDPVAIVTRLRKMKYPVEVVAVEVIRTK